MRSASCLSGVVGVVLLFIGAAGAETVTLERDVQLRAEPSLSAAAGATVKQGTRAELIEKRGVWINVKSSEAAGWTFTFNVRYGERQAGSGDAGLGRVVSARPTTQVTSTIGIRGLSEEDLQKATFNAAELQLLDGYAASKESAQQQARASALQPVNVDYFGVAK